MPIKNLTLGLVLMCGGVAIAQDETYTIRNGDTISGIAARFHVREKSIVSYNGLSDKHRLKVGRTLTIPGASASKSARSSAPVKSGTYAVRNGDHDWSISRKNGLTVSQLHSMNPGLDWRSLQIGQRLNIGRVAAKVTSSEPTRKIAMTGTVVVRDGDNDWIIARRLGIKPSEVRQLNPGTDWSKIKPGQILRAGAASTSVAANLSKSHPSAAIPSLRSRYAAINTNAAIIRAEPNTTSHRVAKATAGTRVVVLDHESEWYKLRFPHGTEGWVRGDLLRPVSKPATVLTKSVVATKPKPRKKWVSLKRKDRPTMTIEPARTPILVAGAGAEKVLKVADTFRGVRYRFGSASRSGTDCSGFTSQVFRSVGVKLPRVSREQATVGVPVKGGQMKQGDLVFFHTSRGRRITHVGIYVGGGKFIHADTGKGRVAVSSLSDGYYRNRFVTARRVVKGSSKSAKAASVSATHRATKPATPKPATKPAHNAARDVDDDGVIQ